MKILSMIQNYIFHPSYVWTYNECGHVPYVAKTDDNVVMNVTRLLAILRNREARDVNKWFIACSVPSRNIATGMKIFTAYISSSTHSSLILQLVLLFIHLISA